MTVEEFRKVMAETKYIPAGSELHLAFHAFSQEALKITAKLNGQYHTPDEIRQMMAELSTRHHLPRRDNRRRCDCRCWGGRDERRAAAHGCRRSPGKNHQGTLKGSKAMSKKVLVISSVRGWRRSRII